MISCIRTARAWALVLVCCFLSLQGMQPTSPKHLLKRKKMELFLQSGQTTQQPVKVSETNTRDCPICLETVPKRQLCLLHPKEEKNKWDHAMCRGCLGGMYKKSPDQTLYDSENTNLYLTCPLCRDLSLVPVQMSRWERLCHNTRIFLPVIARSWHLWTMLGANVVLPLFYDQYDPFDICFQSGFQLFGEKALNDVTGRVTTTIASHGLSLQEQQGRAEFAKKVHPKMGVRFPHMLDENFEANLFQGFEGAENIYEDLLGTVSPAPLAKLFTGFIGPRMLWLQSNGIGHLLGAIRDYQKNSAVFFKNPALFGLVPLGVVAAFIYRGAVGGFGAHSVLDQVSGTLAENVVCSAWRGLGAYAMLAYGLQRCFLNENPTTVGTVVRRMMFGLAVASIVKNMVRDIRYTGWQQIYVDDNGVWQPVLPSWGRRVLTVGCLATGFGFGVYLAKKLFGVNGLENGQDFLVRLWQVLGQRFGFQR